MRCPKCQTRNPEGAGFCLECGAGLALVCPECGTRLPSRAKFCLECGATVTEDTEHQGKASDRLVERVGRLVPREYAERLTALGRQATGERRIVTILFCDVVGSTALAESLDPEDVMEIMDGAFDVMIEPILRYEGTVARLMGDAVLAFFGAPIAHEDDPERACRAALEMVAGVQAYAEELARERGIVGFNVRVGINTGLVFVGEVGSDLRVEYTAMGDAINVAARMEQNAPPGGVLITHDTYRHVRGVFTARPQEATKARGKKQPVQTYLVTRVKPRAFRRPVRGVEGIETRMIGRVAELTRLQEAFYAAMEDRELQMVTIIGEAGVGKSRLLQEFDNWAELLPEQFYLFKGRATREMQHLPYALIRDVMAFRFQIQESDPPATVREKLEHGMGVGRKGAESHHLVAHVVGRLLGFELGDSSHLTEVLDDAQEVRDRGLAFLCEYFEGMAARLPILIMLEDLHCADASSLDALDYLTSRLSGQPMLVVCVARPALLERRPQWGEAQSSHRRLWLELMSKRNTRRLLREILQKVDHVPQALSQLVVGGAEGNPFFVEELVKMLVEDGVIIKGEDRWRVEPSRLTGARVPATLRGLLQGRLDRLSTRDRTVLQQASVVGRLFWDRPVVHISQSLDRGMEEKQVLRSLSALQDREMVFQREPSAFSDAKEYIFKHALLREVTYEGVPKRRRRIYHGLVADWLIERGGERAGEYAGLIADHLELAGRTAEAVEYLMEAGDRARGLYAHQEAIGAYERVLRLLKGLGDRGRAARTLMKLGLTYHTAFDFQRSREAYQEGFALWQEVAGQTPRALLPSAPHPLRLAQTSPSTLDPATSYWPRDFHVIRQLFRGLVELGPRLEVLPCLAEGWEVLKGGHRYRFHLREDSCWSDGTRLTAHDIEFAWKRVLNPATDAPYPHLLYDVKGAAAYHHGEVSEDETVGVHAVDDVTLLVDLERPTGYFLQLLNHEATFPVPRHVVEDHGDAWVEPANVVTNGSFDLVEYRPGESLILARNAHYGGGGTGNVERVEITLLDQPAWEDRVALYEPDEVDALDISGATVDQRERLRLRYADDYFSAPALTTYCFGLDVTQPPLQDPRVRRGLTMALDREVLAAVCYRGHVLPATGGAVPPGMPGHSPGIGLPYDPERARLLLAEAGYPGGHGLPPLRALLPKPYACVDYIQSQWRQELDVDVEWEYVARSRYRDRVRQDEPHLSFAAWSADYPDPDSFLRVGFGTERIGWRHDEYNRIVADARRLLDQPERMALYRRADRILVDQAPVLAYGYGQSHALLKPWVKRYARSAIGYWSPWRDVVIEPH